MSKNIEYKDLQKEHEDLFPKCNSFCLEINRQIEHLLSKENIQLAVPLQFRAKTFESISNKLQQGRFNIKKSITELQDLAGLRIITLFKRDAIKVTELINTHFKIINQYNTEDKLDDTEFGYSSIHIVCKIKDNWLDLPTFTDFKNLKLEIQIRTLSQHSWAEASNIFQYKREDNVPKPLKRSISRISALLETVDLEFERLLSERDKYKFEVKQQITNKDENQVLNVDILQELLHLKLPNSHKRDEDDFSALLDNLNVLGFNSVESLNLLIDNNLHKALEENERICSGFKSNHLLGKKTKHFENYGIKDEELNRVLNGVFFSYNGLVRHMLSLELGQNWSEAYSTKRKVNII